MKFVVALTVAAVFVSLLALTSSEMMLASGRASAVALTCPVTLPTLKVKAGAGFGPAGFNFGNRHLRAELWPHGQLVAGRLPGVGFMATVSPVGSIHAKQGWWRGVSGKLTISGRRLDAAARPLRSSVPDGYGSTGFQPAGLTFSTVGCWKVVGKIGRRASLTFVVKVRKVKGNTG